MNQQLKVSIGQRQRNALGGQLRLAGYLGAVKVLIDFLASWCGILADGHFQLLVHGECAS